MPSSGGASLEMAAALAVDPPRLMPTFEELRASSASVVFPQSITNGVDNHEFVRYDMDIPDAFQKYKLALDHYDNPKRPPSWGGHAPGSGEHGPVDLREDGR